MSAPSGTLRRIDRSLRRWVVAIIAELRRTRRVIVSPEARPRGEAPIFVCGVHRSGTTLLRLVLDSHSHIACPPESFFIRSFASVLGDAKAMEGLRAMGFDRAHVIERLRDATSYFFEMYAAAAGKPRWADKTPSYVEHLDLIETLFGPECRYLILYRHGLDAARSIVETGIEELSEIFDAPREQQLVAAARYWADRCERLRRFQARFPDRCLELRYETLTREPERELRRVFEFLGEPFESAVLLFHEHPHDHWIGLQDRKAAESTGFEPRTGTWRDEDPAIIRAMLVEAGRMLETLGYSPDPDA